jgi:hypothetical protein
VKVRQRDGAAAALGVFAGDVDLEQHPHSQPGRLRAFVEFAHKLDPVDGVKERHLPEERLGFVGLQVPDVVKLEVEVGQRRCFVEQFLRVILPKFAAPRGVRLADGGRRLLLADGDQRDARRIAFCELGCARDAFSDGVEVFFDAAHGAFARLTYSRSFDGPKVRRSSIDRIRVLSPSAPLFDLDSPAFLARLRTNLAALAERQPALAERLARLAPVPVLAAKNGEPTCQFTLAGKTRWLHSAYDPGAEARRLATTVPEGAGAVMVVGGGLGHLPAALASERPERTVIVVESELRFLRAMFSLFDVAASLRAGRFVALTADDEDEPLLAQLPAEPFVLRLPPLQEAYADRLRHVRFLRRRPGSRGRIVIVAYKLFVADIVSELEGLGFAVRVVEPAELTVDSFRELAERVRPHLLFSMNHSPELALVATRLGMGYVSWTIDPLPASRLRVHPGTDVSRVLAYAHRREFVAELQRAGLPMAAYLPLAAGRHREPVTDATKLAPYRTTVSFAGVSLAVEREGLFRRLRQFGSDAALEARLEAWLEGEFRARGLVEGYEGLPGDGSALPAWLTDAVPRLERVELTDRINGTLSHLLRLHRVRALLPLGVHVYGDEGWQVFAEAYQGRAEHGAELSAIYSASAVNLDVPRLYQRDIATMRVFDILACGGVLLTEPTPQLLEFFRDGEHLYTYRNESEMIAKVRQIAGDLESSRRVAERGRALVTREHLLSHRVARIVGDAEVRGLLQPRSALG